MLSFLFGQPLCGRLFLFCFQYNISGSRTQGLFQIIFFLAVLFFPILNRRNQVQESPISIKFYSRQFNAKMRLVTITFCFGGILQLWLKWIPLIQRTQNEVGYFAYRCLFFLLGIFFLEYPSRILLFLKRFHFLRTPFLGNGKTKIGVTTFCKV